MASISSRCSSETQLERSRPTNWRLNAPKRSPIGWPHGAAARTSNFSSTSPTATGSWPASAYGPENIRADRAGKAERLVQVDEDHTQHLAEQTQHNQHGQEGRQAARPGWDWFVARLAPQASNPGQVSATFEHAQLSQLLTLEGPVTRITARARQHVRQ